MMRRRVGPPPGHQDNDDDDSSSSDEDVFSKLSRKNKEQRKTHPKTKTPNQETEKKDALPAVPNSAVNATNPSLPPSTTSSMKRHHKEMSGSRKAKMDALLEELEQEKKQIDRGVRDRSFVPTKKGSFVDPDEEHVTTNIFVGNLAPTLTEEEVTDLFRQFGDLYSVKIMWPRTPEERARNRHTGFVCFMNRADAEEAMAYCSDADPFNVGRPLVLRWGKNVKKETRPGPGGTPFVPIQKRALPEPTRSNTRQPVYDPEKHFSSAILVTVPQSKQRAMLISMVASYVAKDGSALEQMLQQEGNPEYGFLNPPPNPTATQKEEHIYYRWRVYSFAQGDGFFVWRTEPFCMFLPHGCFWVPPPLDANAAQQEMEHQRQEEERLRRQKQERTARRDFVTGRQLERARKGRPDGGGRLTREEMDEFHILFRQKLCASRESICVAMAFCFEKSGAARQIADLLKELLLEEGVSIETRVARLYLLSDILFNSQQPGVKNAFFYRDAIERFAPEIFAFLGKSGDRSMGRISQNKLATAVSRVLAAWTSWSVYTPVFLDQLQDLFEGKEVKTDHGSTTEAGDDTEKPEDASADDDVISPNDAELVSTSRKGEWKEIDHEDQEGPLEHGQHESRIKANVLRQAARHDSDAPSNDVDGDACDADGEPIDPDGEILDPDEEPLDADGEPVDPDGEALDADGEPLDADGEPIDPDGEALDPDGEPLETQGEPIDVDGEPITDRDGQPIDPDSQPVVADRETLAGTENSHE